MEFKWAEMPSDIVNDAFAIREEVFVKEQGFEEEFDEKDKESLHVVGYDGEVPVCCARIFYDGDNTWHAGRIAVKKIYRGTGLGADLMKAVCEKARSLGGVKVELGAQLRASGFYAKQGFERVGEEYKEEGCPHIGMAKNLY